MRARNRRSLATFDKRLLKPRRHERQDRLQVFVIESELETDEIVAAIGVEDIVHTPEEPQFTDELVRKSDSPTR